MKISKLLQDAQAYNNVSSWESHFGLENQGKQGAEAYKESNKFWVQDARCPQSFLVWDWRCSCKVESVELCSCFNNGRGVVISVNMGDFLENKSLM